MAQAKRIESHCRGHPWSEVRRRHQANQTRRRIRPSPTFGHNSKDCCRRYNSAPTDFEPHSPLFEPGTYMNFKNGPRLGPRRIAEEWSREPGTQSNTEILTRLLSAFWRREFVGHDAPDPQVTLTVLKRMGAFPREYWDDENPPTDEFEFLASIPPDGYDETAPECYGTVAWSILDGIELPAEVLAGWCDAHDILKPFFWFGSETGRQGTAKAQTDLRKWLGEKVKKGKSGAKVEYWNQAKSLIPALTAR